ncbi:MAG TPA: zinc metallopeptidase [Phycisphaerales bacterium]|nr:zinc metallopeptidase [Phycisphaerales bacterium]
MYFDPLYLLIAAPFFIFGLWAQFRVKSAYARGSQVASRAGWTGAHVAREILNRNDMHNVDVEVSHGMLSDHYDPKAKVVRLSPEVYGGTSLAALGIAAHEVGHAIQDRTQYSMLAIRNAAVPMANIGSQMSWIIFFAGLMLSASSPYLGRWIMWGGVALFGMVVFFQVVNLPVEFDASNRAKAILVNDRFIAEDELPVVKRVLGAAAMTYVAATLTAIATLIYFILRAQGARRD